MRTNPEQQFRSNSFGRFLLSLSTLVALLAGYACGGNAEDVFKSVSPGVVLIQDPESHGSGVVLDDGGRILTCFHVVNTPLPLTVTAQVSKNGRMESMTLDKVEIVSVHKTYDLAIIKVSLPAGARLSVVQRDATIPPTGSDCYVIGNPGGANGAALTNSISTGVIGAAERAVQGKSYIQTTAPINPGNSGGALVNKHGRMVGVVSFVISETEGIGFAIPLAGLQMDDFGPLAKREPDIKKALEYQELAHGWFRRADQLIGESRDLAFLMALHGYRLCLSETPNDPSPYNNLGTVYMRLDQVETASYFFKRANELAEGKQPLYLRMLGVCLANLGKESEAIELWKQGLKLDNDNAARSECAENLAISAVRVQDYPRGAYFVKWANALGSAGADRMQVRSSIFNEASQRLSEKQLLALRHKTDGFSFEDLADFSNDKVEAVAATSPSKRPVPSGKGVTTTKAFKMAMQDAPDPGKEGIVKAMPAAMGRCVPVYGGIYLAISFPDLQKIGIFNIAQVKFDKYLPLPTADAQFASGGSTLIVYDPAQNLFHLYDLNTFAKTGTKICRIENLGLLEMGGLTPDKALVTWHGADDHNFRFGIMNIPEMTVDELKPEDPGRSWSIHMARLGEKNALHARVSPDLTRAVFWRTKQSPSTFTYARIDGSSVSLDYKHLGMGGLTLAENPDIVVAANGTILDSNGTTRHSFEPSAIVAVASDGGNYAVGVTRDSMWVYDAVTLTKLNESKLPMQIDSLYDHELPVATNRLVHASAYLNRVAVIDPKAKKIAVMLLREDVDSPGAPPGANDASPGQPWSRQLNYPMGTKVIVEDAPAGFTVDAESMKATWNVTPTQERGKVVVLLSVTAPGKDETYDRLTILVR